VREAVHAPRLLPLDEVGGVEVLHLAGEVDEVVGRVELRDLGGAGLAGEQVLPGRLDVVSERGDGTHARDHDSAPAVL